MGLREALEGAPKADAAFQARIKRSRAAGSRPVATTAEAAPPAPQQRAQAYADGFAAGVAAKLRAAREKEPTAEPYQVLKHAVLGGVNEYTQQAKGSNDSGRRRADYREIETVLRKVPGVLKLNIEGPRGPYTRVIRADPKSGLSLLQIISDPKMVGGMSKEAAADQLLQNLAAEGVVDMAQLGDDKMAKWNALVKAAEFTEDLYRSTVMAGTAHSALGMRPLLQAIASNPELAAEIDAVAGTDYATRLFASPAGSGGGAPPVAPPPAAVATPESPRPPAGGTDGQNATAQEAQQRGWHRRRPFGLERGPENWVYGAGAGSGALALAAYLMGAGMPQEDPEAYNELMQAQNAYGA